MKLSGSSKMLLITLTMAELFIEHHRLIRGRNAYRLKTEKIILQEIHDGICGAHEGASTIARKIMLQAHPQTNGIIEVTNRTLIQGIKKRLDEAKGNWVDELYSVLWAYSYTSIKKTGETLFRLAYGIEAIILVKIGMPRIRVNYMEESSYEEKIRRCLDLLEERRNQAEAYKKQVAQYHNRKVKPRKFEKGDLVLRNAGIERGNARSKTIQPKWEGPYIFEETIKIGAYKLKTLERLLVPRYWNIEHLKKCYH
ncbi:uncharacterized protein LOC126672603 [Mercurialis annua]|uniref:uncharacterized protein LOC126672603 n=1 Tax=Mercurialis annua TaxID=3986 RepID=UPI00215E7288|nr:uncharacterized protein LOC126672603 [Mercurialis annua]